MMDSVAAQRRYGDLPIKFFCSVSIGEGKTEQQLRGKVKAEIQARTAMHPTWTLLLSSQPRSQFEHYAALLQSYAASSNSTRVAQSWVAFVDDDDTIAHGRLLKFTELIAEARHLKQLYPFVYISGDTILSPQDATARESSSRLAQAPPPWRACPNGGAVAAIAFLHRARSACTSRASAVRPLLHAHAPLAR